MVASPRLGSNKAFELLLMVPNLPSLSLCTSTFFHVYPSPIAHHFAHPPCRFRLFPLWSTDANYQDAARNVLQRIYPLRNLHRPYRRLLRFR
jgi:hypothetical protein